MRRIVLPGEQISEKPIRVENAFTLGGKSYSKILGLYENQDREVVPLEGVWEPHIGDTVVGIVSESRNKVYGVDLSYFKRSILVTSKFDRYEFVYGDIIEAAIKDIEGNKTIILSEPKLLKGGMLLKIKPVKVPRVIGKQNTMVKQIIEATQSEIIVGVNGIIWISGGNDTLAIEAILRIENEAHVPGLTERIKLMLETKEVN
jgi:exosome complex component RRP4